MYILVNKHAADKQNAANIYVGLQYQFNSNILMKFKYQCKYICHELACQFHMKLLDVDKSRISTPYRFHASIAYTQTLSMYLE